MIRNMASTWQSNANYYLLTPSKASVGVRTERLWIHSCPTQEIQTYYFNDYNYNFQWYWVICVIVNSIEQDGETMINSFLQTIMMLLLIWYILINIYITLSTQSAGTLSYHWQKLISTWHESSPLGHQNWICLTYIQQTHAAACPTTSVR